MWSSITKISVPKLQSMLFSIVDILVQNSNGILVEFTPIHAQCTMLSHLR